MISGGLLSHNIRCREQIKNSNIKETNRKYRKKNRKKIYHNWLEDKKKIRKDVRKETSGDHLKNSGAYAIETRSKIELKSLSGALGCFGILLITAGLVVTKMVHPTFGPVGVGVGVYCVAVSWTLILERRNSNRKLVYIRDLYTNAIMKKKQKLVDNRIKICRVESHDRIVSDSFYSSHDADDER